MSLWTWIRDAILGRPVGAQDVPNPHIGSSFDDWWNETQDELIETVVLGLDPPDEKSKPKKKRKTAKRVNKAKKVKK